MKWRAIRQPEMELATPKNGFCESCHLLTLSPGAGK